MSNDFTGAYGVPDPAAALRAQGVAPAWHDARAAFGGGSVWADRAGQVVAGGEVILDNAAELRQELAWPDAADGQLVAELWARHGMEGISRARGMYAVALWDARQNTLTLLRDAVGARTLYYAHQGSAWWFGTRLRTVRRCPIVSDALSLSAMQQYLICAFVPGEQTLWRDIREVRPGTLLKAPQGETHTFWEPTERPWDPAESLEDHAARLRSVLESAVRDALPANGPTGVFLSGGLDSSLVAALVARDAVGPVHTFAIHFGAHLPHELEFSGLVAQHCRTQHHIIELPSKQIRDTLFETLAALDDPIGDPLTVPNLILGRAAARETNTILNGEGGDPCFGGPKNIPMLLHALYGSPIGDTHEASGATAYLRSFQKCYDDLPRLLTPDVQTALRELPPPESLVTPFLEDSSLPHYLNRLMLLNTRLKGADHILTKVNNLSSATGLLARSPLFDPRVVAASFAIPPEYKLAGSHEKAVLKSAVRDLLPPSILTRPKSGMLVPVQRWFQRDLKSYARRLLLGRDARTRPFFTQSVVKEWLAYRGGLWPRHGVKLWLLLTLEVWLRAQEK
ncbi:MAG: asparagine synthase-related protein [Armatimonadota bacterium]|nr:asparagine synthase-related protein [Armatimonadota bacterium]